MCAAIWAVHRLLDLHGWLGWAADMRRRHRRLAARAVAVPAGRRDHRHALHRSHRRGRSSAATTRRCLRRAAPRSRAQVWDAVSIAARILLLNVLALVAALILPGVGLILAWIIGGYAIGRGLFAAVAMRRMPRPAAEALYRRARPAVLAQGCILALAGYVPVLNLLIPVVGTAAMVHVLDRALRGPCGSLWITAGRAGCSAGTARVTPIVSSRLLHILPAERGAGVQTSQA